MNLQAIDGTKLEIKIFKWNFREQTLSACKTSPKNIHSKYLAICLLFFLIYLFNGVLVFSFYRIQNKAFMDQKNVNNYSN